MPPPPDSVHRVVTDWRRRRKRTRQNFLMYLPEGFAGDSCMMEGSGRFCFVLSLGGHFTGTLFQRIIWLSGSQNLKSLSSQWHWLWVRGKYWQTSPWNGQVSNTETFKNFPFPYHDTAGSIFWWKLLPLGTFDNHHFQSYKRHHWKNTIWTKTVWNSIVKEIHSWQV